MRRCTAIITLVAVALIVSACGAGACSSKKLEAFRDELDPLLEEWDDANEVANNTARINLSSAINELQRIRREVDDLEPPPCEEAEAAQKAAVKYMEARIDLYMAFMSEASEDDMETYQYVSSQEFDNFSEAMEDLNESIGE